VRTPRSALLVIGGAALLAAGPAAAGTVQLRLSPKVALRDVPLDVRVSGLESGERVKIQGEERSTLGRVWQSRLSARADADGSLVLPSALLEGLMDPVGTRKRGDTYPSARSTIRVSVLDGARELATGTAVRILLPPGVRVREIELKAAGIVGRYFRPAGRANGAPILFLGGSEGGLPDSLPPLLLAGHGHPVLALAYFSVPGLPPQLKNVPLEYFQKGLEWLRAQPEAHGREIVVAGASRGGEAALLIGSTYPDLVDGVIALVPSDSIHGSPIDPLADAWSVGGKPLDPAPIALEKIDGPIFAVGALQDRLWPSGTYVLNIRQRLAGHRPKPTTLVYRFAGHMAGVIVPNVTTFSQAQTRYGLLSFGGTRTADERARERAWPLMLDWLDRLGRRGSVRAGR
jgi:dienelactone hydrolase